MGSGAPYRDSRDKLPQNEICGYINLIFGEDEGAIDAYLAAIAEGELIKAYDIIHQQRQGDASAQARKKAKTYLLDQDNFKKIASVCAQLLGIVRSAQAVDQLQDPEDKEEAPASSIDDLPNEARYTSPAQKRAYKYIKIVFGEDEGAIRAFLAAIKAGKPTEVYEIVHALREARGFSHDRRNAKKYLIDEDNFAEIQAVCAGLLDTEEEKFVDQLTEMHYPNGHYLDCFFPILPYSWVDIPDVKTCVTLLGGGSLYAVKGYLARLKSKLTPKGPIADASQQYLSSDKNKQPLPSKSSTGGGNSKSLTSGKVKTAIGLALFTAAGAAYHGYKQYLAQQKEPKQVATNRTSWQKNGMFFLLFLLLGGLLLVGHFYRKQTGRI